MNKTILVGVVVGLVTLGAAAQSAKDAEKNLRDALVKKQMFMRGFSEEPTIEWKWNGKELVEDTPKFMTLGGVTIKSVKLNGEKVVIQGDRQILVRTEGHNVQFTAEVLPVTINVDLHGANVAEVLPTLPGALFYPDLNNAVQQISSAYAELLPTPAVPKKAAEVSKCDCAHPSDCSDSVPMVAMAGMKPPHGKTQPPEASPDARYVTVVVNVDETGKAQEIWLGRPLGPQADDEVLTAVKGYDFSPATCHDKPVSVAVRIDVPLGGAAAAGGRGRR